MKWMFLAFYLVCKLNVNAILRFILQHTFRVTMASNFTCNEYEDRSVDFNDQKVINKYLYTTSEQTVNQILYPTLLASGIISNTLFLVVCAFSRQMHTTTNFYLANLALADVTFLVIGLGEELLQGRMSPIENDASYIGKAGCIVVKFFSWFYYVASILIVTVVTADRYYAICRPIPHQLGKSSTRTIKTAAVMWIAAFTVASFSIPTYSYFEIYCAIWPDEEKFHGYPDEFAKCVTAIWWATFVFQIVFVLFVQICLAAVLIMSMKILRKLHTRTQRSEQSALSQQRSMKLRNHVAFMLTVNAIVFFLCQAPYQTTVFVEMVLTFMQCPSFCHNEVWNAWIWVAGILLYINSVVNPIIYNLTNPQCRREFIRVLFTPCRRVRRFAESTNRGKNGDGEMYEISSVVDVSDQNMKDSS